MGLFRKMASMSTMGAVNFRSDKERTARKSAKGARAAKRTAQEAQAQTRLLAEQNRLLAQQTSPAGGRPIKDRLAELDQLARSGVITEREKAYRRAEILRGV
jgi:hypothetical protein